MKKDSEDIAIEKHLLSDLKITKKDVEYFKKFPEQIDEVADNVAIHSIYIFIAFFLGCLVLAFSKLLKLLPFFAFINPWFREYLVDFIYEIGGGLIGGAIVALILGTYLKRQQQRAKKWRSRLKKKIKESQKVNK